METATTPTEGRPQIHPSWIEGEPMFLSEAFPAGNERRRGPRWLAWAAIVTVAAGTVAAVYAMPARGQEMPPATPRAPCHDAAEIAKQLSKKYTEAPVAFGLQSNGNLLQVYSSELKGTWTIVSTTPSGMSCIIAVGKLWEQSPVSSIDPMA